MVSKAENLFAAAVAILLLALMLDAARPAPPPPDPEQAPAPACYWLPRTEAAHTPSAAATPPHIAHNREDSTVLVTGHGQGTIRGGRAR